MRPIPKLLSKTKLMRGYRCEKCIYLTIHSPELEAPISAETQALFDQGNMVGQAARTFMPGGHLIDNAPWDFSGALANTRQHLAQNTPIIYEAAFEYMGCYARADILVFSESSQKWRIYEVKSTTKVKPEHLDDVGLQVWIMAKSGLPIEQINIMHLNTNCRYPDLSQLFVTQDVTDDIRAKYLSVQPKVREIFETIRKPTVPDVDIGSYCLEPGECGFKEHCWQEKQIPPLSVFNLPGIHQRLWDLYYQGIISLDDPRLNDLTELQERAIEAYKTHERFIDAPAIQAAMAGWVYPYIYLDFETINPAIPRYDGTKPYQQVPFQFSVHEQKDADSPVIHHAYLHENSDDPRPELIPALLKACGTEGSIIAYYGKFESARITELAEYSPEHKEALLQLCERIVDPLPTIKQSVYDNQFQGSFSLKTVAPSLLGEMHSYDDMLVPDGGAAQRAFEELISEKTTPARRKLLKQAMLDYCEKDTAVMVDLVQWLQNTSSPEA